MVSVKTASLTAALRKHTAKPMAKLCLVNNGSGRPKLQVTQLKPRWKLMLMTLNQMPGKKLPCLALPCPALPCPALLLA